MLNNDIGVILNGNNEILSVEPQSNNPRFYYLRYFSCTRSPEYYNVVVTKNSAMGYFKCFRCGKMHPLKSLQEMFSNLFNGIYNMLIFDQIPLDTSTRMSFIRATFREMRSGNFIVI